VAKYEAAMKGDFLKIPYIINVQTEVCKRCGACEKRCQFGALKLEENKITLDADKCWGLRSVQGSLSGRSLDYL